MAASFIPFIVGAALSQLEPVCPITGEGMALLLMTNWEMLKLCVAVFSSVAEM